MSHLAPLLFMSLLHCVMCVYLFVCIWEHITLTLFRFSTEIIMQSCKALYYTSKLHTGDSKEREWQWLFVCGGGVGGGGATNKKSSTKHWLSMEAGSN